MIFTSLGLLLVAACFLIAGIAKSSVTLLMVSLLLTIGAGVVLVLVTAAARRLTQATAPGMPASSVPVAATGPQIVYVPVQLPAAAFDVEPASNGHDIPTAPILGYDDMTAEQVITLLRSGALGPDQLDAVRRYESANQGRRTVLRQLDRVASAQ